jgi:DNA repair protein RecO (recombination protein O)
LDHLTQAEVHCARPDLHGDLERLLLASYLVDLVGGASAPGEPCAELYGLLIQALDNLQTAPTPLLCRWVEMRLAEFLGYAPQLEVCALCGASDPSWFSAESGGTVCRNCRGARNPGGVALSPPARAALRHLRDCRLESALRVRLPVQATREVERALFEHLQYHNPQTLGSREVLRSLLGQT